MSTDDPVAGRVMLADLWAEVFATLEVAWLGLEDFEGEVVHRRNPGWRTLVAFGRSVTFHLQKLKNCYEGFEVSYKVYQQGLADDPVCKFFSDERIKVLKAGPTTASESSLEVSVGVSPGQSFVDALTKVDGLFPIHEDPPPEAINSACSGPDENGGFYWIVRRPHRRTVGKVYMQREPESATVFVRFAGQDWDPAAGARHYLDALEHVVEALCLEFEPARHSALYGRNLDPIDTD